MMHHNQKTTLGILGGGQLGWLLALVARRFGLRVKTFDPAYSAACASVAEHTVGSFADSAAVLAFAAQCEVLTFELESIPQATIALLETEGYLVAPNSRVLAITQDRLHEKELVRACKLKSAPFTTIDSEADLERAMIELGLPAILKTRCGGYDGKGQWRVGDRSALYAAFHEAQSHGQGERIRLILESVVPFERELSILAARGRDGKLILFPVVENIHRDGILRATYAPAEVSSELTVEIEHIARVLGEALEYVGVFAVETFCLEGEILVNEIAPRVHNSGHYTLEACSLSQFEAHLRAILGYPLTMPRLLSPAVMLNLLGSGEGDELFGIDELLEIPEVTLYLYGKGAARALRKMGHVTILGRTLQEAQARADSAATKLSWGTRHHDSKTSAIFFA